MSGFESQNAAERQVVEFLHEYKAAFESFEAGRICDHFTWPVQVTGDEDEGVSIASFPGRDPWFAQIETLLMMYRTIGVVSAYPAEIRVDRIAVHVLIARVTWRLMAARDRVIYQFHASYTL